MPIKNVFLIKLSTRVSCGHGCREYGSVLIGGRNGFQNMTQVYQGSNKRFSAEAKMKVKIEVKIEVKTEVKMKVKIEVKMTVKTENKTYKRNSKFQLTHFITAENDQETSHINNCWKKSK